MMRPHFWVIAAFVVTSAMATSEMQAVTISLAAVQDASANPSATTTNYDGQLVRVTRQTSPAGALPRGVGIVAFDLSSIAGQAITAAHLEYYQVSSTSAGAHVHEVYTHNPADGVGMLNESTITYATYVSTYASPANGESATAVALGALSLASNSADNVYHIGGSADAADLAYLNSRASKANATDQYAQFLLWHLGNNGGTSTPQSRRVFGDLESGNPVRLVLTVVPEPSAIISVGIGVVGMALMRLRKRK
jgi:hypothetical protein